MSNSETISVCPTDGVTLDGVWAIGIARASCRVESIPVEQAEIMKVTVDRRMRADFEGYFMGVLGK
jgi:hypothetical protein